MLPPTAMGFIHIDVAFRGPGGNRTLRMLVDTGATYTWIPEAIARELGSKAVRRVRARLGDGRDIERTLGELEVEILGRRGTRFVVWAERDDATVVGVDTLEGLLLGVDPVEHTVKPLPHSLLLAHA